VINATWANHGHELARACWASFELDAIVSKLRQSSPVGRGSETAARAVVDEEMPPLEEVTEDPCPPVLVDTPDGDGDGELGGDEGELQRTAT
jgi:hypothetical protein